MYTQLLGGVEYSFDLRLGVTVKLKKAFGMKYTAIVDKLDSFDIHEWIKIIYNCLDEGQFDGDYNDFLELMYAKSNVGEIQDTVMALIKKLQYPEKSLEEIDEMLKKNLNLA